MFCERYLFECTIAILKYDGESCVWDGFSYYRTTDLYNVSDNITGKKCKNLINVVFLAVMCNTELIVY